MIIHKEIIPHMRHTVADTRTLANSKLSPFTTKIIMIAMKLVQSSSKIKTKRKLLKPHRRGS